jgi:tetratricopeptide (TPR) repeat protein
LSNKKRPPVRHGDSANRTQEGRIELNGQALDDVRTRLRYPSEPSRNAHLSMPVEHHSLTEEAGVLILRVPALTLLQLYHDGVLAPGNASTVNIRVAGVDRGPYTLGELSQCIHNPNHYQHVLLRLIPAEKTESFTEPHVGELPPLKLEPYGLWNPAEEYWADEGEPIGAWAKPIIARGPRPMYEMEQVLPGSDVQDADSDPILTATDLRDAGRLAEARQLLMRLIQDDPRCLDAYAHLGIFDFDKSPKRALLHYERGVEIGRHALGPGFHGVLAWGLIDNRPFLRCLHGLGLCLWRLQRFEEAEALFQEMLWLNPNDNQGVRFLLPHVRRRECWRRDAY